MGQLVLDDEELSFEPPEVPEPELVDESELELELVDESELDEVEPESEPDEPFEAEAPEPDDDRLSFL